MELYILPPLFFLPSISGSCISALTLCNLSLDKSLFTVFESWDLSLGLPALKDGETWYRGYTNIKSHLAKQRDIDSHLTAAQRADITAWGSLIEDLGDTLAWNSLFVSRQNYLGATRREVSLSLPFPYGFILPTRLRAYALRRCAEIGMIEDLEEEERPSMNHGFTDTWLTRRRTWDDKARSLKLHVLASDFYTPLSNLVSTSSEKVFLFSNDSPSSLDAVLYGHLCLHLLPTLPDPTLRTTLMESHPKLAFYLHKCHEYFEQQNTASIRTRETTGWNKLVTGWGVEKGKRKEDLMGIGVMVVGIMGYALVHAMRNS